MLAPGHREARDRAIRCSPYRTASPWGRLALLLIAAHAASADVVPPPGSGAPPPQAPPAAVQGPDGLALAAPPGWQARPRPPERPEVLFLLEGPPRHAFALSRFDPEVDSENRAVVRAALAQVVGHVNRRARSALKPGRGLKLATFPSGARLDYLVSGEPGRPALAVGLCRFRGRRFLAIASGRAPDADMRRILATLTASGAPAGPESRIKAPEAELTGRRWPRAVFWSLEGVLALSLLWLWRRSRRGRG